MSEYISINLSVAREQLTDLLNKEEVENGIKEIKNLSKPIDIIVNNAGINHGTDGDITGTLYRRTALGTEGTVVRYQ